MPDVPSPTYTQRPSRLWWLRNPRYLAYMVREVSSFFVLIYALVFLALVLVSPDPNLYGTLVSLVESPAFVIFSGVTLAFVAFHSVTWWSLTSRVVKIRLGGRPLPPWAVFLGALAAWAAVSVLVYILIFGGSLPIPSIPGVGPP